MPLLKHNSRLQLSHNSPLFNWQMRVWWMIITPTRNCVTCLIIYFLISTKVFQIIATVRAWVTNPWSSIIVINLCLQIWIHWLRFQPRSRGYIKRLLPSCHHMKYCSHDSLAQIIGCRLIGHYLNQCWNIVNSTLGTNFIEILNEIHTFSFKKMHLKMSSAKWRQFCLGFNVFSHWRKISPHGREE